MINIFIKRDGKKGVNKLLNSTYAIWVVEQNTEFSFKFILYLIHSGICVRKNKNTIVIVI